jgi:hypothetical protein
VAEQSDLFASQSTRAATLTAPETHVFRLQGLSAQQKELRQT